jgi:hypothetical protein
MPYKPLVIFIAQMVTLYLAAIGCTCIAQLEASQGGTKVKAAMGMIALAAFAIVIILLLDACNEQHAAYIKWGALWITLQ